MAAFDVASLFVADVDASKAAATALVNQGKNEGVEFFGSIGLVDAMVKVSIDGIKDRFLHNGLA